MISFDYQPRTRIVFGPGKLDSLGDLAGELGARRVLLVSDHGIIAAGHAQRAIDTLAKAKIETHVFSDFHENPSSDDVEAGVKVARRYDPELIVGLGGGSSMDCAKGINFVYSNGGRIHDYWGTGKALKPMLPMIAVPTTAGTGSEAQSYALISDAESHVKMACGDKKAACRVALLDPSLTVTQPRRVTALTGIDAIAHALETYVTKPRNPISLAFSREAWRLLAENFAKVLDDPNDLEARGAMQLGACFAGMAIENSMLGATHALANPLTAEYGIVHGQAIGLMLPHVIRYNGEAFPDWYRELSDSLVGVNGFPSFDRNADGLATFVAELVRKADLPQRLSDCGVSRESLPKMAEAAAKQWTGTFNPRQVGGAELLSLYERAF
jgi:alcohol dehydrogenase